MFEGGLHVHGESMEVDSGHALVIVDVGEHVMEDFVGTSATEGHLVNNSKMRAELVYSYEFWLGTGV